MLSLCVLAVVALVTIQTNAVPSNLGGKKIVCYYGSWAKYRSGSAVIDANKVEPGLCTHFVYTFIGLDESTASPIILDSWNDIGDGSTTPGQLQVIRDKAHSEGVKYLLGLGGWNEGSEKYSRVIGNAAIRPKLIQNILAFLELYEVDGLDMDWEYPAQRGGKPSDREAFAEFMAQLYSALQEKGMILSTTVLANPSQIDVSYDVPSLCDNIDFINVMNYDYHGDWDTVTGHNAPLYASATDSTSNTGLNIKATIEGYISAGCDPSKLNLGLPSYGRGFLLSDPSQHGIESPSSGPTPPGYMGESGVYGFDQICPMIKGWAYVWDTAQQVPYVYNGNKWIGFDDIQSFENKVCYALSENLGGVMVWSVDTDDFSGGCGLGEYPLLNAIIATLQDPSCNGTFNSSTPPVAPSPTVTPPPTTRTPHPTGPNNSTVIPTPGPINSGNGACTSDGQLLKDPNDCSKFIVCSPGEENGEFTPVVMQCSSGLDFNPKLNVCDYPQNVQC